MTTTPQHHTTPHHTRHAPSQQRGLYGGLVFSGAIFGVLLGAVVGTTLHEAFSPRALQR